MDWQICGCTDPQAYRNLELYAGIATMCMPSAAKVVRYHSSSLHRALQYMVTTLQVDRTRRTKGTNEKQQHEGNHRQEMNASRMPNFSRRIERYQQMQSDEAVHRRDDAAVWAQLGFISESLMRVYPYIGVFVWGLWVCYELLFLQHVLLFSLAKSVRRNHTEYLEPMTHTQVSLMHVSSSVDDGPEPMIMTFINFLTHHAFQRRLWDKLRR